MTGENPSCLVDLYLEGGHHFNVQVPGTFQAVNKDLLGWVVGGGIRVFDFRDGLAVRGGAVAAYSVLENKTEF